MYERLLSWMCTQENLVDEAETLVRKEMPVGAPSLPILPYLRVPNFSSWTVHQSLQVCPKVVHES